ncbi:MAG: class I SAM-dependent RNA methyltransferase [Defluviitaleaceae bacterium]|nr:class I SAM-dependent RNA methyltransferase [Defluviitaleaceae bacterium]MCL2238586.1 class I SAM-dependent RNA methyltransferase [Defluviitaleaceae bacterium]
MGEVKLVATAAFGLEAVVKREAVALGFTGVTCVDNRVDFSPAKGELLESAVVRANLWLRSADRVLLRLSAFEATSFDMLFEGTRALPWGDWIPPDGKFTVTGKSVKSGLFSVPDVQSIVKKAVVEKLKAKYKQSWFAETGAEYTIQVSLLKNVATLTIDTTGAGQGLHKRGYRAKANEAPLKETMAAALIALARYNGKENFLDPCCGSGTLPIEAALMARNIAPGLGRKFACEEWPQIRRAAWKEARAAAYAAIRTEAMPPIFGADADPAAIVLAKANAELAGVDDCIVFENRVVAQTHLPAERGIAIVNPPYGERLGRTKEVERLYAELGKIFNPTPWHVYVITPDEFFEAAYKKKARAKRKLFNGMIKVDYYQYF